MPPAWNHKLRPRCKLLLRNVHAEEATQVQGTLREVAIDELTELVGLARVRTGIAAEVHPIEVSDELATHIVGAEEAWQSPVRHLPCAFDRAVDEAAIPDGKCQAMHLDVAAL